MFIIIININLFQFGLKINAQQKSTITNYHQKPENKKKNIKKNLTKLQSTKKPFS